MAGRWSIVESMLLWRSYYFIPNNILRFLILYFGPSAVLLFLIYKITPPLLQWYPASAPGIFYRSDIALAVIATLLYFKLCLRVLLDSEIVLAVIATLLYFKLCLRVLLDSEIVLAEIATLLYYIVRKCTIR